VIADDPPGYLAGGILGFGGSGLAVGFLGLFHRPDR
jgi:hypothetical protein